MCLQNVSTFASLYLLWGCLPPEPLNMSAEAFCQELKWQKDCIFSSEMEWVYFKLHCAHGGKNLLLRFLLDSS